MNKIRNLILILLTGMLISACGGGGSTSVSADTGTGDVGGSTQAVQQKVDLSWSAPTTRTDGSALSLSELVGYRVYYGTSQDSLSMVLDTDLTNASIIDLTPGIYYFAVTAYDADGLESGFSEIVSKQISS